MAKTTTNTDLNGIHLDPLRQKVQAIQENSELAKSRFQITNKWISGGKNSTTVSSFISGGAETRHSQDFTITADEPAALGGRGHPRHRDRRNRVQLGGRARPERLPRPEPGHTEGLPEHPNGHQGQDC